MGSNSEGGFDNTSGLDGQGMWGLALRNTIFEAQCLRQADGDNPDPFAGSQTNVRRQDKGKRRETQDVGVFPFPSIQESATQSVVNLDQAEHNTTTTSQATVSTTSKSLNKEDILRRANDRRAQLKAELDRVRTQLWETTVEQGVLAQLVKHY